MRERVPVRVPSLFSPVLAGGEEEVLGVDPLGNRVDQVRSLVLLKEVLITRAGANENARENVIDDANAAAGAFCVGALFVLGFEFFGRHRGSIEKGCALRRSQELVPHRSQANGAERPRTGAILKPGNKDRDGRKFNRASDRRDGRVVDQADGVRSSDAARAPARRVNGHDGHVRA